MLASFARQIAESARRRPLPWTLALLTTPVALFYLPLLLGTHTFPDGDFTHHFLPFALFRAASLGSLHLPVWNPATFSGHPFLADTQAGVFYPFSAALEGLTLAWQGAAQRLYLLQLEAILETMLAGGFVFLLARALGAPRWAAILGGVTFALSGYLTAYPPLQLAVLRSAIWLPALLWLLLRTAQTPHAWRYPLALAATGATTIFAGHPQTWLHIAYVAGVWTLLLAGTLAAKAGWRGALRFLVTAILAACAGLALAAVQLLPSLEFFGLSVRASVEYAFVSGGFPIQDTWQMLLPGVLTFWSPLFVGVPALICALAALVAPAPAGRTRLAAPGWRAAVLFFAAVALLGLLVSFGANGFLYPLAWRILPGWNLFRGQERAALLVALGLSVLAALGAHALAALAPARRRALAAAAVAGVAAAILVYLFAWQLAGHSAVGEREFLGIAATAALAALLVAALLWQPGWSQLRAAMLLTLATAALFLAHYGVNLEAVTPTQRVLVAPELIALQAAVRASAPNQAPSQAPGRVYNEYRVHEDYAMRLGVEDLWGSSPLRLDRYAHFNDNFPLDRWWRLTGVSHLLTWRRELFAPSTLLAEFPQATDTTYLHVLNEPNPRAWFVTGVTLAEDEAALAQLADHTFNLADSVVLPAASGALKRDPAPTSSAPQVQVTRLTPESLAITVDAPSDGLVVVAENWMPGWRVTADGIGAADTAPIFGMPAFVPQRANLAFLAIPIPAGAHALTLTYAPASVTWGLWISLATLLFLAALTLGRRFPAPGRAA